MSTNLQVTKSWQIRISDKWHRILKLEAAEKGMTMAHLLCRFLEDNHPKGYGKKHNNN